MKHSQTLFSLFIIGTLLLLLTYSCKKNESVQISNEQSSVASLVGIVKASLNEKSIRGQSLIKGLESIGMNPDWSEAKTVVNSKNKTVLSIPLEKTMKSYSELNVIVNDGIPHEIVKRYTTSEDNLVQLEIYALNGTLLKIGNYNPKTKRFLPFKLTPVRMNLFVPNRASTRINVSVLELLSGQPKVYKSNYKSLSVVGDEDGDETEDPEEGEDLHEVIIVGTPPDQEPTEDPSQPSPSDNGPTDYFPSDPVGAPAGDSQGEQALVDAFINNIDTTNLKPCMVAILKSLILGDKGKVTTIIKLYTSNIPQYNWVVKDGSLSVGTNAETESTYNGSVNGMITTFDSQKFSQASDLSIARTIMHESVHAWLVNYYRQDNALANADYATMIDAYNLNPDQSENTLHHDEIVRDFVGHIADGLQEFGDNKGYTFPTIMEKLQFYNDLAWGGLTQTQAFRNLPTAAKDRISNTISTEQYQKDTNGVSTPSKGTVAGC